MPQIEYHQHQYAHVSIFSILPVDNFSACINTNIISAYQFRKYLKCCIEIDITN